MYTKHKTKVTKRCKTCGKGFESHPSEAREFCCQRCSVVFRSPWSAFEEALLVENYGRIPRAEMALLLGKKVKAIDAKIRKKFPELKKQKPPVSLTCTECGRQFTRSPSLVKARNHFCSMPCKSSWQGKNVSGVNHPRWAGGYEPYYGPNWGLQRTSVRARDGYMCQCCGALECLLPRGLDVHHIRPFRTFAGDWKAANAEENLVCLCQVCHQLSEHGHYRWEPIRGVPMLRNAEETCH